MRSFEASVTIAADPSEVWPVLCDVAAWPAWDSGVTKVRGRLAPGARLRLTVEEIGNGYPFKVAELVPGERIVLTGRTPLGVFTGVRTYALSGGHGSTVFTVREEYSGRFARAIATTLPDLDPPFQRFAEALKRRVEGGAPNPPGAGTASA